LKLDLLGENKCNVFEKRELRRTFAPERGGGNERGRKGVREYWRILHNKEVQICTFHQIFLNDRTKADGRELENSLKMWRICKQFLSESLKERESTAGYLP